MPAYRWLEKTPADAASIGTHMKALRRVGVPYTDDADRQGRRRGQGQDRDGRAGRLPAIAGPGAQVRRSTPWTSPPCASSPRWPAFATFIGIFAWAYARPQPRPLRGSRAHSLRGTTEDHVMSDFIERLLVRLRGRHHPGRHPGLPAAAVDHGAQEGGGHGRQHHRPRLGRGPDRDEQPDAALVDVAVRRHHRLLAAATWSPIPGLGTYEGKLGWSAARRVRRRDGQGRHASWRRCTRSSPRASRRRWPATRRRMAIGERLFMNNCAQCHGSDARGSKGFPNLTDTDWLHGGTPDKIAETITHGPHRRDAADGRRGRLGRRREERRPLRAVACRARRTTRCARSWARASSRACAACHGIDGKGNQALGAPNLTDDIWLHGYGEQAIIAMINNGKTNVMPAQARQADRRADPRAGVVRLGPVEQAGADQALSACHPGPTGSSDGSCSRMRFA